MVELKRFSEHLGAPLNLRPKYFPVSQDDAARLIVTVEQRDGADAAMQITGAILALVWVHERDIADHETSFFSRVHPDDLAAVRAALTSHFDTGERFDIETRLRHRTVGFRGFRYRGQAAWDDHRRP